MRIANYATTTSLMLSLLLMGCTKWVDVGKHLNSANASIAVQVTSAKIQSGQLVLTGSGLDSVNAASLATSAQSAVLTILTQTATTLVLAANSSLAMKQVSLLTLQTANAATTYNLTVDLGGTTVSNFSSTGIIDQATTTSVTITSTGKVGIGTATPTSTLTVNGSMASKVSAALTSNYTLTASDNIVLGNAAGGVITFTLPTAVGIQGRQYTLKKTDSSANILTVAANGTEKIDGTNTTPLSLPNQFITVTSDGGNWIITGSMGSITACPTGMKMMGRQRSAFCIENTKRTAAAYYAATTVCRNLGFDLCSAHDWQTACNAGGTFVFDTTDAEWASDPYSSGTGGQFVLVGNGGCDNANANYGYAGNANTYRCCVH